MSAVRAIQHLPQLAAPERVKSADTLRAWLKLTAQTYGRAAALAVLEEAGGWPAGCGAAPRLR